MSYQSTTLVAGGALTGLAIGAYLAKSNNPTDLSKEYKTLAITTAAGAALALTAKGLASLLTTEATGYLCLSSLAGAIVALYNTEGEKPEKRLETVLFFGAVGAIAPIIALKAKSSSEPTIRQLLKLEFKNPPKQFPQIRLFKDYFAVAK
jgi:hypothetical protein